MYKNTITDWELLPVIIDMPTACCVLRCTRQLVVRMIQRGDLTGCRKVGREWRIPKESIKQYFAEG